MSLDQHVPRAGTATDVLWQPPLSSSESASTEGCHPAARHLGALEHALTVALAPLDYPSARAWADAVASSLQVLTEADVAEASLSSTGALQAGGPLTLWARDEAADCEPRGDRAAPGGAHDALGIRVRAGDGAVAAVVVRRATWRTATVPPTVIAAFRAIAPAFRAGVERWVRVAARRCDVSRVLDSLSDAALLFGMDGTVLHANQAVERLGTPSIVAPIQAEAQRVAWSLAAVARRRPMSVIGALAPTVSAACMRDATPALHAMRTLRVGPAVYTLRGSVVGEQLAGQQPAVLVMITAAASEPLSDATLRDRFGLTTREIQVARLVADGLSNNEIAERLGVRFFTARNHVERALAKLGVASRHRVGPLLRNESPELRATAA